MTLARENRKACITIIFTRDLTALYTHIDTTIRAKNIDDLT